MGSRREASIRSIPIVPFMKRAMVLTSDAFWEGPGLVGLDQRASQSEDLKPGKSEELRAEFAGAEAHVVSLEVVMIFEIQETIRRECKSKAGHLGF